jgi:hypothetical protein
MSLSPLETSLRRNWGRALSMPYSQHYRRSDSTNTIRVLGDRVYVQNASLVIANRNTSKAPNGFYSLNLSGGMEEEEPDDPWASSSDPARHEMSFSRLRFAPVLFDMGVVMNMSIWAHKVSQAKGDIYWEDSQLTVTGFNRVNSVADADIEPFPLPEGFVFPGGKYSTRVASNLLAIALHDCKRQSDPSGISDGYVQLATYTDSEEEVKTIYLFNVGGWQSPNPSDLTPRWDSYAAIQTGVTCK